MDEGAAQAIRQADAFYKNICLLFEDTCALVQEKCLSEDIRNLQGPEGNFAVWHSKDSESQRLYIFEARNKIRFIRFLVKVSDTKFRGSATKYKAVCARLGIDPVAPLIVTWGIFEPRDAVRFAQDAGCRRHWADNVVLLDVPDSITLANPDSYDFDTPVLVGTEGIDSWYCERATVKIRGLMKIRDSHDIEALVGDVLGM